MGLQRPAADVPTGLFKSETLHALCGTCRDLLIQPDENPDTDIEQVYHTHGILTAKEHGCPICVRLYPLLLSEIWTTAVIMKTSFVGVLMTLLGSMACDDVTPVVKERGLRFEMYTGSIFYYLRPSTRINDQFVMQTERFHPSHPYLVPIAKSIAPYSGSDSRLTTMKSWLDTCNQEHSHCQASSIRHGISALPARAIHVPPTQRPALISVQEISGESSLRYATLSH
jgi:hypothetical protein